MTLRSFPALLFATALAWAEAPETVTLWGERDRTPAVQNELYGELVKRAAAGVAEGERVPHDGLMDRPAELRGKPVRWEGVLLADPVEKVIEPVPLAPGEAPPDVSQASEAVVLDPVSGTTVIVTFLEPGPRPAVHGRIVLDGVFWKLVSYQNRRGETVCSPYLVARTWRLAPREEPGMLIPILMGVTGGLAIASIVIGAQASRKIAA